MRYGIFIYRDNTFQIEDIDKLFSFLCIILEHMEYSYKPQHVLDDLINNDTVIERFSDSNPIHRVAHDIKYSLFNRNYSESLESGLETRDKIYEDRSVRRFHTKLNIQILLIFHFMNDLRQNYLLANNIELFYQKIYLEYKQKISKKIPIELSKKMHEVMVEEFEHLIPDSHDFHEMISYKFPSIDMMYDNEEFNKFSPHYQKRTNNNDEFILLMVSLIFVNLF